MQAMEMDRCFHRWGNSGRERGYLSIFFAAKGAGEPKKAIGI